MEKEEVGVGFFANVLPEKVSVWLFYDGKNWFFRIFNGNDSLLTIALGIAIDQYRHFPNHPQSG